MSAFLVTRSHMHRVVSAMLDVDLVHHHSSTIGGILRRHRFADEIGRALFDLNGRSVRGKYAHHEDMQTEGLAEAADYVWTPAPERPPFPRLLRLCTYAKAVSCLVYQCNEDATERDPLLAELKEFEQSVVWTALAEVPQWQAVPWGFDDEELAA